MSSRTRLPERESDFSWEDPYDSRRRRHTPPSRGPRKWRIYSAPPNFVVQRMAP